MAKPEHEGISPACASGDHDACTGEFDCPGCRAEPEGERDAPCECECHNPPKVRATPKERGDDAVRPRFGRIMRGEVMTSPVVFREIEAEPGSFEAVHAADESPVAIGPDERLYADVLGPGQRIVVRYERKYRDG